MVDPDRRRRGTRSIAERGTRRFSGRKAGGVLFAAIALLLVRFTGAAFAAPAILPLDQVRPGMTGIGRTVFSGDSISTFPITIIDVIPRARPQGNLILFRAGGSFLEHSGIIAGMSGSPVYIDGRLVGAVAFAYPMLKDPIGGITPIEEMLAVRDFPGVSGPERDGIEAGPVRAASGPDGGSMRFETDPLGASSEFSGLWAEFTRQAEPGRGQDASTVRWNGATARGGEARTSGPEVMAIPINLQGWEGPVAADLGAVLRGHGYMPTGMAGGGAPLSSGGTGGRLEPGDAVAIPFIEGDASLAAIGTVTVVDGDDVIAFGHPLIQGGPVSLPMCRARIHSVMPNLEVSFKLGTAGEAVGGIYQDRRAGVAGSLGPAPEMLPVRITIRGIGEEPVSYHYRVVRDRILTPFLLPWPVTNSWLHTGWAQGDAAATCRTTVGYNHGSKVERTETLKADAPPLQFAGTAILPATLLLTNPFERATLDSIGIDLTVERRNPTAYVTGVRCDRPRARVGETLRVAVTVEPWRGAREERVFTLAVRPEWAGRRLQIAAGGAAVFSEADRDRAPGKYTPRDLGQLVALIESFPRESQLWLRVYGPGGGNLIDGRENSGLPPSIAAAGRATGNRAVIRPTAVSLLQETPLDTPWILDGSETTEVEVMP